MGRGRGCGVGDGAVERAALVDWVGGEAVALDGWDGGEAVGFAVLVGRVGLAALVGCVGVGGEAVELAALVGSETAVVSACRRKSGLAGRGVEKDRAVSIAGQERLGGGEIWGQGRCRRRRQWLIEVGCVSLAGG